MYPAENNTYLNLTMTLQRMMQIYSYFWVDYKNSTHFSMLNIFYFVKLKNLVNKMVLLNYGI